MSWRGPGDDVALTLRLIPDPALRQVCGTVTTFDDAVVALGQDMLNVMYAAKGRGLAAPQLGRSMRMFVMDAGWKSGTPTPAVFVNPEIIWRSDRMVTQDEVCLSIPDQLVAVTRPDAVRLRWQDQKGGTHMAQLTGFEATCVQHEVDHLDGRLITDLVA